MTPKWPWTLQGKRYLIFVHWYPREPNFTPFCYSQPFSSYMRLCDKRTEWPTLQGQGTPYMFYYCLRIPYLNLFRPTAGLFRVPGHFKRIEPNDSKMALNSTRSKVIPIISYYYPWVLKFNSITLRPPCLSCRPFWDECAEWPQNYLEHYKVKGTSYMLY